MQHDQSPHLFKIPKKYYQICTEQKHIQRYFNIKQCHDFLIKDTLYIVCHGNASPAFSPMQNQDHHLQIK